MEGEKLYETFRIESLDGNKYTWDAIAKQRFLTFTSKKKVVKVKL